jgi:prepilin-type N-terminal cleavage/methylation domain-containing protein
MVKKMNTNDKGFSLIELMIVVAIIGLLAAIGIPQYAKFQAKARQAEAKSALSALFTAEASFFSVWNQYTIDLKNMGFGVAGSNLRYVTGFAASACTNYITTAGAPAETVNVTNTWSDGANANVVSTTTTATWIGGGTVAVPATFTTKPTATTTNTTANCNSSTSTDTCCVSTAGAQEFKAVSGGDPNNAYGVAATQDVWSINTRKVVANPTPGIQ